MNTSTIETKAISILNRRYQRILALVLIFISISLLFSFFQHLFIDNPNRIESPNAKSMVLTSISAIILAPIIETIFLWVMNTILLSFKFTRYFLIFLSFWCLHFVAGTGLISSIGTGLGFSVMVYYIEIFKNKISPSASQEYIDVAIAHSVYNSFIIVIIILIT